MNLENYYPERVFHYFTEISKIPRCSGNEKAISDYLVDFAKKHNLFVYQDESNNILIRKKASEGYEKYESICLQGHMDMVCDKNKDVEFDFCNSPINIYVEDGYIKARGTTLGADNGISVAICLSILESDTIKHPALEILLTTDEEVSMSGAENFDVNKLESKILVNIDSEEYGSIYVSSAGCSAVSSSYVITSNKSDISNIYEVELTGLLGGHSGADIHENTANANNFLANLLFKLSYMKELKLISINGGSKNNTIPREASAKFVSEASFSEIKKALDLFKDSIAFRYVESEKLENIKLEVREIKNENYSYLSTKDTKDLLAYIVNHPTGVIRKSNEIEGLIQTSTNLGILETRELEDKKEFYFNSLVRSSKTEEQRYVVDYLLDYAKNNKAKGEILDFAAPWEYKEESKVREYFKKVFFEQNGYEPRILAIHAGLECGIFAEKNADLDIISIGPDIKNPHTPDEKMSLEAVKNTWEYLIKILEGYKID
ncbi:beta-Ala-His dipeptidase [Oceanivirga miroungae]|uniref:Cytosol non-specific dipeptidase n=1 Tax=Oceanivirga miroungae TaxID=1130046 RepID=A0A6I8MEZ7_9FUSO|nr:beta-Ala-His dipeptidase [Oceanivirga miroungae]VWL85831.1 aminoacyl-histidine dipeptidase [Oceanivirga miroungae]